MFYDNTTKISSFFNFRCHIHYLLWARCYMSLVLMDTCICRNVQRQFKCAHSFTKEQQAYISNRYTKNKHVQNYTEVYLSAVQFYKFVAKHKPMFKLKVSGICRLPSRIWKYEQVTPMEWIIWWAGVTKKMIWSFWMKRWWTVLKYNESVNFILRNWLPVWGNETFYT